MKKRFLLFGALILLIAVSSVISTGVGAVFISPADVLHASFGSGKSQHLFIIQEYRLPRVVLSILVGAGLAVAGTVLQGIIRNPLASPDIIGITKGAGLTAVIVILLFPKSPVGTLPWAALAGGLAAALLLYLLSYRGGMKPITMALSGIAIGALFSAGIQYMTVRYAADANTALLWLAGSLWGRGWNHVLTLLPWVVLLLPLIWLYASKLDTLNLGDDVAQGLGVPVTRTRMILFFLAVGLTAACVSVAGSIGFLGLVAPHIARRLVGPVHSLNLPLSALLGSLLLLLADGIGRILLIPKEVPAGIIIAVIGAPYFLYLLRREYRSG